MTSADEVVDVPGAMDSGRRAGDPRSAAVHAAAEAARHAARAAGVQLRELAELDDLDAVYRLYDRIWRPDPKNPPVTIELLRALAKAGNYVCGAFDETGLVGASVGFFAAPSGAGMHSHIAGVAPSAHGRSIGFALKLHQRGWAMERGVVQVGWTFDPLVCRNAYFNLVKLAATAEEYLPNFYGGMKDEINGNDDSDRLLVQWDLQAAAVAAACAGAISPRNAQTELARGAVIALSRSDTGRPVAGTGGGQTVLVAVPHDVEAMRRSDPQCAIAWRGAVREVLLAAMADGGQIAGFDKSGWYVVERPAAHQEEKR